MHIRMIVLLWLGVFLGAVPGGGALHAAADPPPLGPLLARIQEAYDATSDLKASFVQEVTLKTMNRTDREEGVVYYKTPRRMLWDYQKPKPKKLVLTLKQAWFYIPEDRIVYAQDADRLFRSRLTIRFFAGQGRLEDDFLVEYPPDRSADEEGNPVLSLKPKVNDLGVDRLLVTIDRNHHLVRECRFADPFGNTTRIRFRNHLINTKLPDRLFTFKPPPGVEVVPLP